MPLLDILWSMLWFFIFIAWIWLLVSILGDVFASNMSGWGKAGWSLFVIILPLLGTLVYLIVNGDSMQARSAAASEAVDRAQRDYIRSVAGSDSSVADEISKLASLRDAGTISDEEFQAAKAKLVSA